MDNSTEHSCYDCRHYHGYKDIESWEMPHISWWVHHCNARQGIENLKQFPFLNTSCKSYETRPNRRLTMKQAFEANYGK